MNRAGLFGRLRTLVRRRRVLGDYDAEVASHLEQLRADFERQGYSTDAARREARRQFGGVDQAREAFRDASGFPILDAFAADLRYGLRMLRRQPGFSALVVLLVAIGVGANTAIFSLVNTVLLRPLSYPQPDRLAVVRSVVPAMSASYPSVPAAAGGFLLWQTRATAFESMAALTPQTQTLTGAGEPARVEVLRATASLLPMLGARPALGRTFRSDEDREGAPHVAVVTDVFWRQRMNADPSAVGHAITLDDTPYTVVGVLPQDFRFPRGQQLGGLIGLPAHLDVIRPAAFTAEDRDTLAGDFDWAALGRLAPGATAAQAEAQINAVQADIVKQMGLQNIELKAIVVPLHEQVVGQARQGLVLLAWSVITVLLVLAVNLANLLLARISARSGEAAIRTALGATRARVMRQVVLENLLLAGTGGLLGVGVAWAAVRLLALGAPVDLPRLDEVRLDPTVFAVAVAISLLTGLLISLAPAWRLGRANPQASLRANARGASDTGSQLTLRSSLVAVEVALSTVLIVSCALLATSFSRLMHVDTGFAADRVVFAGIAPSLVRYEALAARTALDDRLLERLRRLPGVSAVSLSSEPPLQGEAHVRTMSRDNDSRALDLRPVANVRYVEARYFELLGIGLKAGRFFDDRDRTRSVALVNERLAAAMWPGQNPIGHLLREGNEHHPLMEVIGLVGDTRDVSLYKTPYLMVYVPYWTDGAGPSASLLLRTELPAEAIVSGLQRGIWDVDPTIPAPTVTTFHESVRRAVAPDRFQLLLVLGFALSAVVLAALGIYGVPAFAVAQRSQELSIRLALGAAPNALVRMVVRQGLVPVAIGLVFGLGGALVAGRLMQSLLFEAPGIDPRVLVAVPVGVAFVALIACYLPARRAARIDPVQAMKWE